MSSQGWPQMSHLEERDRDPCTPAHNRCVVIGNNFPRFLGWKTLILGPRILQTPHTCRRPQSSEFHLLEIKPCFPSGRGSTKEFRVTPHSQEPSGHPGRAPAPGPLLSSYPQVPALPGWLPLFPHCPKCHRSSAHSAPCLKYNLPSLKAFLHGQAHSPSPSLMPTRGGAPQSSKPGSFLPSPACPTELSSQPSLRSPRAHYSGTVAPG